MKGEHVNTETAIDTAPDTNKMGLREWSRSRRVPLSTAYKAVKSGRITRDPDGKIDPDRADREWAENTRPRIDGRVPIPQGEAPGSLADEDDAMLEALLADMQQSPDWCGAPDDEQMSVRVAKVVDAHAYLMKRAALERMIDRLAPILAVVNSTEDIRAILAQGIEQAEDEFAEKWRERWG